jgi:hypothetical protein
VKLFTLYQDHNLFLKNIDYQYLKLKKLILDTWLLILKFSLVLLFDYLPLTAHHFWLYIII